MLVRRSIPEPPQREPESIQSRLSRLRLEQRAGSRPLFTTPTSSASSTTLIHGHPSFRLSYPNSIPIITNANSRKGPAGPPPPPSWRKSDSKRNSIKNKQSTSSKGKEREANKRRAFLLPLDTPLEDNEGPTPWVSSLRPVPSLKETCYCIIAADLGSDISESIYAEYLGRLPPVFRTEIMDLAAIYDPLSEAGLKALLWGDEYWDSLEPEEGTPLSQVEDEVAEVDLEGEDKDEWEATPETNLFDMFPFTLTRLNLCGSPITLSGLRRLLLTEPMSTSSASTSTSSSSSSSPPARRPTPNFPNLSTLILSSTPNIPFRPPLFDLLSHYLCLRHLSLSGKSLDSTIPSYQGPGVKDRWLPRLASSTPNLITLDLSFMVTPASTTWTEALLAVDWRSCWREMKRIGVRDGSELNTGNDVMMRKGKKEREASLRELYTALRPSFGERKRWLELVM